ncbi:MAG TPA: response regulator [Candidatus Saccharimonadales bacterium]|nr:response regulator [Candidatus Saccharimonadales bacterium]
MNTPPVFRILVIDDNPDIHEDFRKILAADDRAERELAAVEAKLLGRPMPAAKMPSFDLDCASQGQEGLHRVIRARDAGQPYAVAFVDIRMPVGWDGIDTIEHLWKADPALEVVICTAFSDYSADEIVGRLRRSDQLLLLKKPFDNIEVRLLAIALTEKWRLAREANSYFHNLEALIKSRTQELELSLDLIKASENQYRLLFESNPTPIYTYDQETLAFLAVNDAAVAHYGYSKEEFLKMTLRDIALPEEIPAFVERLSKLVPGAGNSGVWRHRTKSGKLTEMEITSHTLRAQKVWLSMAMDVTERLNLEAQLRQSQKMESVGQLAGGIAHDFNNLLTVINGHVGLILACEKLTAKGAESLKEIAEAGKRANALTRQLMTFSRKQEFRPQVVDLNEVVNNFNKMLRRILGEDVALQVDFAPDVPSIKADLGMIEQVLLNLAVNSRDAMPRGGQLRINTTGVTIDEVQAQQNPESAAGNFARLTFSDNGCGIPPEIVGRIFEPFFTTKELDRGTGLGLATVYGIVKQHLGWIEVNSRVGEGTAFHIFFPACADKRGALQMTSTEQQIMGGTETILVVEDEMPLLKLMHHILESFGYKVLESSNGREALEVWEQQKAKIDLLLTDLILPDGMAGPELAKILQAAKPSLKVLYTSGYNFERLAKEFPAGEKINFVQKPFHVRKLAESVFACLNEK